MLVFETGKYCPELFAQGALIRSNVGPAGTGEAAEMDENLPAKATDCVRRGLGEEGRKQHAANANSHQDSKR